MKAAFAGFAHSAHRCICDCVTASPHCTHSRRPPMPDEEVKKKNTARARHAPQHEVPAFSNSAYRQHEDGRGRIVSALELFLYSPCDC